jgi:hypothetical protein
MQMRRIDLHSVLADSGEWGYGVTGMLAARPVKDGGWMEGERGQGSMYRVVIVDNLRLHLRQVL